MMIKRVQGKTIIEFGHIRVVTDMINRHRYNDLRKKDCVGCSDVLWALKESGKGFQEEAQ